MWVCSGTHSDSKPRPSASRASSSMRIAYSVAKMQTPTCMDTSCYGCGVREKCVCVASQRPSRRTNATGAPAGAAERGAVGPRAERVPGGGDPAVVARDGAAGAVAVHGEVADVAPDLVPL